MGCESYRENPISQNSRFAKSHLTKIPFRKNLISQISFFKFTYSKNILLVINFICLFFQIISKASTNIYYYSIKISFKNIYLD